MNFIKTYPARIFIDTKSVAIVKSRNGLIRLEGIGRDFAVRYVIAQNGILNISTEGIDSGF